MSLQKYNVWHIDCKEQTENDLGEDIKSEDEPSLQDPPQLHEWELISNMSHSNNLNFNELDLLGKHDFDKNHNWEGHNVSSQLYEDANQFVPRTKISQQANQPPKHEYNCHYKLSPKQQLALQLIFGPFHCK